MSISKFEVQCYLKHEQFQVKCIFRCRVNIKINIKIYKYKKTIFLYTLHIYTALLTSKWTLFLKSSFFSYFYAKKVFEINRYSL